MDSWAATSSCLYSIFQLVHFMFDSSMFILNLNLIWLTWGSCTSNFFLISFLLVNFVFRWISGWHRDPIQPKPQVLSQCNPVHVSFFFFFCFIIIKLVQDLNSHECSCSWTVLRTTDSSSHEKTSCLWGKKWKITLPPSLFSYDDMIFKIGCAKCFRSIVLNLYALHAAIFYLVWFLACIILGKMSWIFTVA